MFTEPALYTRIILGIDTSCDDTSAAVVAGTTILSNVIASQTQLHKPYGGVFPTVAKQAHLQNILPTTKLAMERAQVEWKDIDGIAVTVGPGLAPALEVGIATAKKLASEHKKPLLAVNHMAGHALSALLQTKKRNSQVEVSFPTITWPVLAITVSGGHTQFVLVRDWLDYEILGQTIDDAAGECLDKVGRMLNLGYPAGPVIEEFAKLGNPKRFPFPLPMTTVESYDLSFSGLKTAARNLLTELHTEGPLPQQDVFDFAASFQTRVFDHITNKLNKLLIKQQTSEPITSVWLGGGVAANAALRKTLRQTLKKHNLSLKVPTTKRVCSDNGAMIALVGGLLLERGQVADPTTAERQPRLRLGQ